MKDKCGLYWMVFSCESCLLREWVVGLGNFVVCVEVVVRGVYKEVFLYFLLFGIDIGRF